MTTFSEAGMKENLFQAAKKEMKDLSKSGMTVDTTSHRAEEGGGSSSEIERVFALILGAERINRGEIDNDEGIEERITMLVDNGEIKVKDLKKFLANVKDDIVDKNNFEKINKIFNSVISKYNLDNN